MLNTRAWFLPTYTCRCGTWGAKTTSARHDFVAAEPQLLRTGHQKRVSVCNITNLISPPISLVVNTHILCASLTAKPDPERRRLPPLMTLGSSANGDAVTCCSTPTTVLGILRTDVDAWRASSPTRDAGWACTPIAGRPKRGTGYGESMLVPTRTKAPPSESILRKVHVHRMGDDQSLNSLSTFTIKRASRSSRKTARSCRRGQRTHAKTMAKRTL